MHFGHLRPNALQLGSHLLTLCVEVVDLALLLANEVGQRADPLLIFLVLLCRLIELALACLELGVPGGDRV